MQTEAIKQRGNHERGKEALRKGEGLRRAVEKLWRENGEKTAAGSTSTGSQQWAGKEGQATNT